MARWAAGRRPSLPGGIPGVGTGSAVAETVLIRDSKGANGDPQKESKTIVRIR